MGGGFIEFLFGDGQNQGGRYQQQPPTNSGVRCCRRWTRSSRCAGRKTPTNLNTLRSIRNSEKQLVDYQGKESAGHHRCRYAQ